MATTDTDPNVSRISHLVDGYEAACTGTMRDVQRAYELLSKAGHALNNGSPNVTDEFIDRAMTLLSKSLERLGNRPR